MVHVASEMEREGFDIPLLIGGATTSRVHTAVKIHPRYERGPGGLRHRRQPRGRRGLEPAVARGEAPATSTTCAPSTAKVAEAHARAEARQAAPAARRGARQRATRSTGRATRRRGRASSARGSSTTGTWPSSPATSTGRPFFQTWELKGRYPEILEDEKQGAAARQLFDDAQAMLRKIIAEQLVRARGRSIGFWPANAVGDDIRLFTDESRDDGARDASSRCASS